MEGVSVRQGPRVVDVDVEFGGAVVRIVMIEVVQEMTVLRLRGPESVVREAALAVRITDEMGGLYCWLQSQGGQGVFQGVRDVAFAGSACYGTDEMLVSFGAARCTVPL